MRPKPTGPQTISMFVAATDGHVEGTFVYDGASGVPSSFVVANTTPRATSISIMISGVVQSLPVPPGTTTLSAAQMQAMGWTDVNTQFGGVAGASP